LETTITFTKHYIKMRKSIQLIMTLAFVIISSFTFCQSHIGVFVGLNNSNLTGDAANNTSYKSLAGINTGLNLDLKLSSNLFLSIQPSYSQEGTNISYTVKGSSEALDSIKIRLNYFSLPLLIKVSTANKRFYAIGGFEPGILLNSYSMSNDIKKDVDVDVRSWNLTMQFGAGIWIPIGFPRLYVELRYSQGLLNLTNEPVESSIIPRVKTTGFKILAGIEFPLQKSNK